MSESQRGGQERREWKGEGAQGHLDKERGIHLDICVSKFLVTPLLMGPVCLYLARTGLKRQCSPLHVSVNF